MFRVQPLGQQLIPFFGARNELVAIGMEYDLAIPHRQPPQPVAFLQAFLVDNRTHRTRFAPLRKCQQLLGIGPEARKRLLEALA